MVLTRKGDIAEAFGVSRRTVTQWTSEPDFPPRGSAGWTRESIDAWCKKRKAGPYHSRKQRAVEINEGEPITLAEANIRLTVERAENERIKKERQLVEQAVELGEILLREDVIAINRQMIALVSSLADARCDARDRLLSQRTIDQHLRDEILEMDRKFTADLAAAMGDLLTK